MNTKECIECREPLAGRADKKFCSDMCRNAYHNRQNSDESNYVRNVNNILRKNRRILHDILKGEETLRCSSNRLKDKDFDFNHFTSLYRNKNGETYYYCYEYGYLTLENNYCCIVRKRKYS
ncbi:MAG: hypothetical protein ACHQRM_07640 [Bacteroidia bacterium]